MKISIKSAVAGLLLAPVLVITSMYFAPVTVSAACADDLVPATNLPSLCVPAACKDKPSVSLDTCIAENETVNKPITDLFGEGGIFKTITNTALYLIGAISVLMLIYGGIRYTTSAGDSKGVEAAKNTIMYAIIGIIVALLAYAIVNFVLTTLITTPAA